VWLSFLGGIHKRHVFLAFGELWFVKVQSFKAQTIPLKAKNTCFLYQYDSGFRDDKQAIIGLDTKDNAKKVCFFVSFNRESRH
jgi:hypothetical protein